MNNYPSDSSPARQHLNTEERAHQDAALNARKEHRVLTPQTSVNQTDLEMRDIDDEVSNAEAASILMAMKHSDQATDRPLNLESQSDNVYTRQPAHNHEAGSSSDNDPALPFEDTRSAGNNNVIPTPRRRVQMKDSLDSDSEDEYVPSQYHRNRLNAPSHWVRRSIRKTRQPSRSSDHTPLPLPSPTLPPVPSTSRSRTPDLDPGEGFMPSTEDNVKFKYDSPTGRSAAELDALFELPACSKQLPTDLRGLKQNGMKLSYRQLGTMPKKGLADELVAQMEKEHQRRVREYEREELAKNGPM